MTMAEVLDDVRAERERQDAKWGVQTHSPEVWASILAEEGGESAGAALALAAGVNDAIGRVARVVLHWRGEAPGTGWAHLREEFVQSAAVVVAAIEYVDRQLLRCGAHPGGGFRCGWEEEYHGDGKLGHSFVRPA